MATSEGSDKKQHQNVTSQGNSKGNNAYDCFQKHAHIMQHGSQHLHATKYLHALKDDND